MRVPFLKLVVKLVLSLLGITLLGAMNQCSYAWVFNQLWQVDLCSHTYSPQPFPLN